MLKWFYYIQKLNDNLKISKQFCQVSVNGSILPSGLILSIQAETSQEGKYGRQPEKIWHKVI